MNDLILSAVSRLPLAIDNPLDGLVPDFSFGGTEFTALWQKLITAIWGIAILISIVYLALGLVSMAGASSDSNPNPQQHAQGRKKALWAGVSLAGLAALALIVGAILSFVG
ncbi:hypothetical protein [Cryobacterium sp. Y29]|jgi:hypothetical protein|uniref:hypothetical protein n=1 Tax=Cryobacterium sp. Y29 TaxID=2048285 RepID=UPI001E5C5D86|nr:hypothetical protein [Cryobacterium sp. Y29]